MPRQHFTLALLFPLLASTLTGQHIAYDEGDGRRIGGFRGEGHGGWQRVVTVDGDMLVATQGNDWRQLLTPVRDGVVWYAVTLRMREPITGYASVVPAAAVGQQFSELGFNTGFQTDQGLWTTRSGVVKTGIAATTAQTFVQRYDFVRKTWRAWAVAGDGRSLLDGTGDIGAEPLVVDAPLAAAGIGAIYLTKGSPQVLEIHRLALARSASEALTPVDPDQPPTVAPTAEASPQPPLPTAGIEAFARRAALPKGATIAFFGDSLTWQGGHIERLRQALAEARPDLGVQLRQRGINGGKSTDLVAGVKELYGSTQAPFTEVLAADRPAAIVIQIGINDVWHGKNGNSPQVYGQALTTMLTAAAAANVPVLLTSPTVIGERVATANPFDAGLEVLANTARELATTHGVTFVDLRDLFVATLRTRNPRDDEQGILTYDGVHLNDDGNALLAHAIGDGLTRLLGEVVPPPVPLPLVPWPRELTPGDGSLPLCATLAIETDVATWQPQVEVLRRMLSAAAGSVTRAGTTTIELRRDPEMAAEHHRLTIGDSIVITGSELEAIARGTATLLQLLRPGKDGPHWPRLAIADQPTCGYRGLLVDVARKPHPMAVLEDLVTLCWLYKIRYLQLHLTDDQAFTFPSTAFPRLATKGHSYTRAELRGLHDFAAARGVTIVPELDVPGHCGAAIAAMPELFKAHDRHHATIAFARPEVVAAIDTLIGELLEVFPSTPYVHVGGDECDLEHVHESKDFQAAFAREGVPDARQLYRRFLCQLRDKVHARGRRMIVWEGFGPEGGVAIPTDVTVMAFEMLYHTPDKLVAAGYPVINTSWQPLYVVNDRCWSEREIFGWHRGAFRHFVEGFPAYGGMEVPRARIVGAQMCAWEQPAERELPSLRRRLPAMAERIWHEDAGRDTEDFLARLAVTDALLGRLLARR
ncbi:MAG: family 20 glycosylhydrolase [Planctomycetes bacterium]|nr:family 20 glycosylhydrolase [Planctomycetota bacterium]